MFDRRRDSARAGERDVKPHDADRCRRQKDSRRVRRGSERRGGKQRVAGQSDQRRAGIGIAHLQRAEGDRRWDRVGQQQLVDQMGFSIGASEPAGDRKGAIEQGRELAAAGWLSLL